MENTSTGKAVVTGNTSKALGMEKSKADYKFGSFTGLAITIGIGLGFYFLLPLIPTLNIEAFAYSNIVDGINNSFVKQVLWFFINFTEPDFIAGATSSIFLIIGGIIAWRLALKGSKKAGFPICYGLSTMWPWIISSQALALLITMYVFKYMSLFDQGYGWVPTFIVIASTPAAILLMYGPSIPNFLTASILPPIISTPIAVWIGDTLMVALELPVGISNLLSMSIAAFTIMAACNALPWMEKRPIEPIPSNGVVEDVYSTKWFIRRVLSHYSEPQYCGNEIVSIFMLVGALIDWIINNQHALGGGILGAPIATSLGEFLPEGMHPVVTNVIAMALSTIVVWAAMLYIPWI